MSLCAIYIPSAVHSIPCKFYYRNPYHTYEPTPKGLANLAETLPAKNVGEVEQCDQNERKDEQVLFSGVEIGTPNLPDDLKEGVKNTDASGDETQDEENQKLTPRPLDISSQVHALFN